MGTINTDEIRNIISKKWDSDKCQKITENIDKFSEDLNNLLAKYNEVKAYDGTEIELNVAVADSEDAKKIIKVESATDYEKNFDDLKKIIEDLQGAVDDFDKEIADIGATADFIDSQTDMVEQAMGLGGGSGSFGGGGGSESGRSGGGSGSGRSGGGSGSGRSSFDNDSYSDSYKPYKSSIYESFKTSKSDDSSKESSKPSSVGSGISRVSDILTSKVKNDLPETVSKDKVVGNVSNLASYLYGSGGKSTEVASTVENVASEMAHVVEGPITDYQGVPGVSVDNNIVSQQNRKKNSPSLAAALFGIGSVGGIVGKKINDERNNSLENDEFASEKNTATIMNGAVLDKKKKDNDDYMKDVNAILEKNSKHIDNGGFGNDVLDSML